MRTDHLLISMIGLFFCCLMILGGFFLFLCPYIPSSSETLSLLIFHHLKGISYFGLTLLFLGVFFLSFLRWLNRRRYLLLKMAGVSVEDSLIAHFVKESIQTLFPNQLIECDVIVKRKKKIEILAHIPFVPEENQESILQEIEKVLVITLQRQCQYERDFILNVSFSVA